MFEFLSAALDAFQVKVWGLPAPKSGKIKTQRNLKVTMQDGVVLLADRYFSPNEAAAPTVLVRSPYGRSGLFVTARGLRLFAYYGYNVVIQSCRGTGRSGGIFNPVHQEEADGASTVRWLRSQPWFNGELLTYGPSYPGVANWSLEQAARTNLRALTALMTTARFPEQLYQGATFQLEAWLWWMKLMSATQAELGLRSLASQIASRFARRKVLAADDVPLGRLDEVTTGAPVNWWRKWLTHVDFRSDPYWRGVDFRRRFSEGSAPVLMIAGWHDLFLQSQMADFLALQKAGRKVRIVIGPWTHFDAGWNSVGLRESFSWFESHLRQKTAALRAPPVRLFLMGAEQWREFEAWPPSETQPRRLHLHTEGKLKELAPETGAGFDSFVFDPAKPPPAVGGARLSRQAGPRNNRRLESRPDVLVYSSAPLTGDLNVIGIVKVELWVHSDASTADFFVRLCDVEPSGRSTNVSDGIVRLRFEPDALTPARPLRTLVELYPTAYRFKIRHRLRLLIMGGSYPRYSVNRGAAEPLISSRASIKARHTVFRNRSHSSAIELPILFES